MARRRDEDQLHLDVALDKLTVPDLKPLFAILDIKAPSGKGTMISTLVRLLTTESSLREIYEGLDELSQRAVQEATHHPYGKFLSQRFFAKYGNDPVFATQGLSRYDDTPTTLRLFFPQLHSLPIDVQAALQRFVPPPPGIAIELLDDVPAIVKPYLAHAEDKEPDIPVRVRETDQVTLLDVKAVLRLIDAGGVKVGESTRRASQASITTITGVLADGDFYSKDDNSSEFDPSKELTMRPFAWPLLMQAAGLATSGGSKLQLTPAGRKATTQPSHEVIAQIWSKWLKTNIIDEFNRIDLIKGQQTKGTLTAVAPRREVVRATLAKCPVGKWCSINDVFRLLQVADQQLVVAHNNWRLYISNAEHGILSDHEKVWEIVEGRYVLALLFEYVATLGLIDVAFVPPSFVRFKDFQDCWGTDDLTCLSRYDGLLYIRLNALGAWCLGLTNHYAPRPAIVNRNLKVLPNLDVVAPEKSPAQADILFLDRFTERRSESVWHLSRENILAAIEQGFGVFELREFLVARTDELPQTADVFLADLEQRASQLARIIHEWLMV